MSGPLKKRAVDPLDKNPLQKQEDSESSHDEGTDEDVEGMHIQEQIQVDFEGRNPCDSDFHGIKQLLQQLFLKAHVDLSQLTDVIIGQNYVGSVVKQSANDEEDDDEDETDINDVFGVTSVINLTEKQNLECVQQLRTLLVELCDEHGNDQASSFVRTLLGDDSRPVGLIINERFVNIPCQIAVPLLGSLSKEIQKAKEKNMPYNFSYYIIICKLYKMDSSSKKNKKKKNKKAQSASGEPEILWSNPEEELIAKEAECSFEFCVKKESDTGLSGQWMEDDAEMTPYRRVLLIPADKLDTVIEQVKQFVSCT